MCLSDRVELFSFVLLARVLLVLVIETRVIHVALTNAIFVAYRHHFDQ